MERKTKTNTILSDHYFSTTSSATSTDIEDSYSDNPTSRQSHLITSLFREDDHIYSIAVDRNILYTGSDTKNIQIQNTNQHFPPFKSTSGLVKAIVISKNNEIFTGHQDGKIRVWRINPHNPKHHKCIATLPTMFDIVKASIRPKNYVQVRRHRTAVWIKHTDAISCLCMDRDEGILYSASWDRTFKVWSVRDDSCYKCVESVKAHDDAVNAVALSRGGVVYSGSADGSVKVWTRERMMSGRKKVVRHVFQQTLLTQECAVTSLAVNESDTVVYCGSSDGLVNFWERTKHLSHGGVLRGHKMAVLCLATAGSLVLSGSADKSICVWRREEGVVHTCLTVLKGHTGPVKCLAVAADGDEKWLVYSGSLDKSVKVWSVSEYMAPDFRHMDFMRIGHDHNRGFEFGWESNTIG